jgi:hypothetical protein
MPALTTRKEARERLLKLFEESLARIIPPDETVPLRGQTFGDFEDQVEAVRQTILPAILEERTALESTAAVEDAGHCVHCGSDRRVFGKGVEKDGGHQSPRPRERDVAAGEMPVLWPVFFPLRSGYWPCRRRFR